MLNGNFSVSQTSISADERLNHLTKIHLSLKIDGSVYRLLMRIYGMSVKSTNGE